MNKLNVFKNCMPYSWKHPKGWLENLECFGRCLKWGYQRITKGISDYDIWELDNHMTDVWIEGIKYLADKGHGYPGTEEFPTDTSWQSYLYKIIELLRKSQEDYEFGEYANKYQKNYEAIANVFPREARTPEENEMVKKWLEEEKRISDLRLKDRNTALGMITHVYGYLWD